jgi:leucyl/phenylalanyl-tRNA---protein transferase
VEAWEGPHLVGGIYGVEVDGAFAAESMFYVLPRAQRLEAGAAAPGGPPPLPRPRLARHPGLTPHMVRLGAREVARERFLARLEATRRRGLRLF